MTLRSPHFMNLDALAKKYGVECAIPSDPAPLRKVFGPNNAVEMAELQEEIGVPGTRFYNDEIAIEPTNKYRPYLARGSYGNPRLYEEYYRGEPLILDSVQSYTELLVAGTWEIHKPDSVPEDRADEVQEHVDFYNSKLRNIAGGWNRFVEHAASFLVFGFSPFEIVWAEDEVSGRVYPRKLAFREQNTVEDWILDDRASELLAVQFATGGDSPDYYTLPATGGDVTDRRFLNCNLNARGNNFEGIPPIRPAIHWIKMKRILAQIAGIAAEKYGVPITQIRSDPAYSDGIMGAPSDDDRRSDLRKVYQSMRAAEAPTIEMPDGLMAEILGPPGTMPDLLDLIRYCDQMITSAFSNEGALLGLQSMVGSYALGEQKERDFLRSAPYYARRIAEAINETILKPLGRKYLGDLPEYPCLRYRVDGLKDASRWLEDVNKLMPNSAWMQIPEIKKAVFNELGVDVDEPKEVAPEPTAEGAPAGPGQKVSDTALNGAQVTSMVTVVQQVAAGQLPASSASRILQKAFLLTPEEADEIVNPASGTAASQAARQEAEAAQEAEDGE
jgi:hypothetical protein